MATKPPIGARSLAEFEALGAQAIDCRCEDCDISFDHQYKLFRHQLNAHHGYFRDHTRNRA